MFEEPHSAAGLVELAMYVALYKGIGPVLAGFRSGILKVKNDRLKTFLQKAAVNPGTLGNSGALIDYKILQSGFIESLRSLSLFDQMLPSMVRVPPNAQTSIVTLGASGEIVTEGSWAPLSKLQISGSFLAPQKAIALVVSSAELLRMGTAGTQTLFANELRAAVAQATDAPVVSALLNGLTVNASSGSARDDIATLLTSITLRATSKPFWLTSPEVVQELASLYGESGPLYPDLVVPEGGSIAGIPLRAADVLTNYSGNGRYLALVDASQLAGESDLVELDASTEASLQMSDAPTDAPENLVSLFQDDAVALKATRSFCFARLKNSAVAALKEVSYSNGSPS